MTPERYARAAELFAAACRHPAQERFGFLQHICGDDSELHAEVSSLLKHHDDSSAFLDAPVWPPSSVLARGGEPEWKHPERIGHYTILGVLGQGGMGVVYRAQQDSPRRVVALKVIRPGLASAQGLRRFEHEAQVLGCLQHPGIAQIHEAEFAETAAGRQPFFAMELVTGRPLLADAAYRGLNARARLELLANVCDAVQHAHIKGVIHRDLKPGNILVDESGQPKILDFGVARVTDADIQVTTITTDTGQLVGTLPYMSPEQLAGDPRQLDVRSDVYALGVIAYELLAGRLPHDVRHRPFPEAIRIVQEADPPALSTAHRSLRGDLDTIVAKALEKDKARRYQSAAELAADIRRYLRDEPITARPASRAYQLRKFARRNKALVGGIVVSAAALVLGVIGTSIGLVRAMRATDSAIANAKAEESQRGVAQRESAKARANAKAEELQRGVAQRESAKARRIQEFLQGMLESVDPEVMGRDATVRQVLDKSSTQIAVELSGEPEVEAAVRHTIGNAYVALGEYRLGEPHLRRAAELFEAHAGAEQNDTLAATHDLALLLHRDGRLREAEELLSRVVEIRQRRLGEEHAHTRTSMLALGWLLFEQGRLDESEAMLRKTLALQRATAGLSDEGTRATINNLANLLIQRGRLGEAHSLIEEAIAAAQQDSSADHPKTIGLQHTLAGILWKQGKLDEAEAMFRDTLERRRRVLGPDHPATLVNQGNLSTLLLERRRLDEAEPLLRATLDSRRRKLGDDHGDTLMAQNELAALLSARGRLDEAESLHRSTLEGRRRTLGAEHPETLMSMNNLGVVLSKQGRTDEALVVQRELYQIVIHDRSRMDVQSVRHLGNYAGLLMKVGQLNDSEPVFREALDAARDMLPAGHSDVAALQLGLGRCLMKMQRFEEAEPMLLDSLALMKAARGESSEAVLQGRKLLIELYSAWGKPQSAAEIEESISKAEP